MDGSCARSRRLDLAAGTVSVAWDGANDRGDTVSPGIYFYRFLVDGVSHRGTLVRTR